MKIKNCSSINCLIVKMFIKIEKIYQNYKLQGQKEIFKYFGQNIKIGKYTYIMKEQFVSINDDTFIGSYVHIRAGSETSSIIIGKGCQIGNHSSIVTTSHAIVKNKEYKDTVIENEIILEDNVWLGSGSKVLGGVTIGKNSIIGAGAVVNKDIPANSIAVGVPARVIKRID